MPNKYDVVHQLIDFLSQYETDADEFSLKEFTEWLVNKINDSVDHDSSARIYPVSNARQDENNKLNVDFRQQFVFLIYSLSKCQDFYTKKFFDGLPINTLLEYSFLFLLNKSGVLKKMDIIHMNMVEYTTGVDVLKRLNKLNLVYEFRDTLDKRSKRIRITSEGKRILLEAMLRMNKMYDVFLSDFPRTEWQRTVNDMSELNNFHHKIFVQYNNKSYSEIIQLTDQIKSKQFKGIYKTV